MTGPCCSCSAAGINSAPMNRSLRRCIAKGKGVFAFGEAGPRIYGQLRGKVPAGLYPDLGSAFGDAISRASPGDVVLLSPACASFDQYESYAHRGDHFKKLVAELGE